MQILKFNATTRDKHRCSDNGRENDRDRYKHITHMLQCNAIGQNGISIVISADVGFLINDFDFALLIRNALQLFRSIFLLASYIG